MSRFDYDVARTLHRADTPLAGNAIRGTVAVLIAGAATQPDGG